MGLGAGTRRGFVDDGPKYGKIFDGLGKFFEADGFDDVSVSAEFVAFNEILFFAGRSDHHDRDHAQVGVRFDAAKHLQPVDFRELEIEEDEKGETFRLLSEFAFLIKEVEGFGAVANVNNLIGKLVFVKGFDGKLRVAFAVFDEQNAFKRVPVE
jgi:hypothetical protein